MNWRPVVGFEGLYEVSDTGLVRSVAREWKSGRDHRLIRFQPEQIKAQRPDKDGYCTVKLRKNGKVFARVKVHHLVLQAFVGPRPDGLLGCHKDHSRNNNCFTNLYWGTAKDNSADMFNNPDYVHPRGMLGKKHSVEARRQMSESHKRRGMQKGGSPQ